MLRCMHAPATRTREALGEQTVRAPGRLTALGDRALVLAACLAAVLPILASLIRGLSGGFVPSGDRAVIAIRAYDVLSSHSPLVGQYSATTVLTGHDSYSLGPLLYWLLALPARFGAPTSLAVVMAAVNAACAAGVVLLARRRGGRWLMVAGALALAVMSRSLVAETYHDIWNPSAALLPFALLIMLCWSLACGERQWLPLTALVASFCAQAELTFVLPVLALLLVALGGLAAAPRPAEERGRRALWWLAALAVAALCWSAPLIDLLEHGRSNFSVIAEAATLSKPTMGLAAGWHALVRAIGVPPWWLLAPRGPFARLADVRISPGLGAQITAAAILALLAGAALAGVRRRRPDVTAAAASALGLCGALVAVAAQTPTRASLVTSLGYTLWWASPAGMWVWLSLPWAAATLAAGSAWRPAGFGGVAWRMRLGRAGWPRAGALAWAAAAAALLGVGLAAALSQQGDTDRVEYRPVRAAIAALDRALPARAGTVLFTGSPGTTDNFLAFDVRAALMYDLRRRGLHPITSGGTHRLGPYYESRGAGAADHVVYVWVDHGAERGQRVIARLAVGAAPGAKRVTIALGRPSSRRPGG